MPPPDASPRRAFERRFTTDALFLDLLACAGAVTLAFLFRSALRGSLFAPLRHDVWKYLQALPFIFALWVVAFHSLRLYDSHRFMSALAEMAAVFRAVSLATVFIAGASFLSRQDYSRAILFLFWAVALALAVLARSLLRALVSRRQAPAGVRAHTLILGQGDLAQLVAQRIRESHLWGYQLVGFIGSGRPGEALGGLPLLGDVPDLARVVAERGVTEVLVARPEIESGELMSAVQACEGMGVDFHLVAGPLQVLTQGAELSGLADLPTIELPMPRFSPWQRALKRLLDVALSLVLLIVCGPLMLGIAALIRRESGASALFFQRRVGYRGVEFTMLKFRTMLPAAEAYSEAPQSGDDARITRTGRWLRRTSLDELPQLVNVLRGEMSLVGPRPEMPFLVAQYEPWQRRRLDVRPGLTGLWQVMGRKDLPLREHIEYDFYYLRNWSIWLDLSILIRTVGVVLTGRGAY